MNEFNTLRHYFTQPNRFHNPYTLVYSNKQGDIICEQVAKELYKEFPNDTEEYIEVPVVEKFGMVCSVSLETIEPDVGYPTDFIEFIETLQFQGWCLASAKSFARNHIEDEYIFEQAALHLEELIDIGDQDWSQCEEDILFKYDLTQDDLLKVRAIYDKGEL